MFQSETGDAMGQCVFICGKVYCLVNSVHFIIGVFCVNGVLFLGVRMGILIALLGITMLVKICNLQYLYLLHIYKLVR